MQTRLHLAARARLELARRPWIHWCLVGALAATVAWSLTAALASVDRARAAWETTGEVVVARRPARPGELLADVVARRTVPLALVPEAAVDAVPAGAVARQRIGRGEIVTLDDVAPRAGPAALAPPGTLIVPIVEHVAAGAHTGDRVVVAADGVELVRDALVVDRVDGIVHLAVRADRAAAVAAAAASSGGVVLLLVP
jgi:hypothetical protein